MKTQLELLFAQLNSVWDKKHGGGFSIIEWGEDKEPPIDFEFQPGDIVTYYDYWRDECVDRAEEDKLVDWIYEVAWPMVHSLAAKQGYIVVDDQDGSDNGLYYGGIIFRKK